MSHIIPIKKINQFLPHYKWGLDETLDQNTDLPIDHDKIAGLEETARDIVLAKFRPYYDTGDWFPPVDQSPVSTTPSLVLNIAAMLVAGWAYDRQFSEQVVEGNEPYGARKVREAYALIEGIVNGEYDLDVPQIIDSNDLPTVLETEPQFIMEERF